MPTYQYACTVCDHRFDTVQAFSDDPLTQCPVCDGRLRKLYGAVGVVFKGSGFYRNDSRAPSKGEKADAGAKTAESGGGGESTSGSSGGDRKSSDRQGGEAKPAAAKESSSKPSTRTDKPSTSKGSSTSGSAA